MRMLFPFNLFPFPPIYLSLHENVSPFQYFLFPLMYLILHENFSPFQCFSSSRVYLIAFPDFVLPYIGNDIDGHLSSALSHSYVTEHSYLIGNASYPISIDNESSVLIGSAPFDWHYLSFTYSSNTKKIHTFSLSIYYSKIFITIIFLFTLPPQNFLSII